MIRLQRKGINVEEIVTSVQSPEAGAVVVFVGTVRADPGTKALKYEAYDDMAESELAKLRKRAVDDFGLLDLAIVHRVGSLQVGESAVAVAAAAPHREAAFEGCSWAIDELKRTVPIWKKEVRGP